MFDENASVKVMPRLDVKRLYVGMTIIFWSLLLPTVIINVVAISLPLLGYSFSPIYYFYLIFVLSGVLLVSAVWMITSTMWRLDTSFKSIGLFFLIAVFMETALWVIMQMMRVLSMEDRIDYRSYFALILLRNMAIFISVLIGVKYFRKWLCYWELTSLAEKFNFYFWVYFFVMIVLAIVSDVVEYSEFGFVYLLLLLLDMSVCCWGFILLHRLWKCVRCILESKCMQCGYLLYGLPKPRCPECGTDVLVVVSDA